MHRDLTARGLLARFVALAVVALLFSAPVMACAMEAATFTVTEAECCHAMQGQCHKYVGPASHDCCRTMERAPDATAARSTTPLELPAVAVAPPAALVAAASPVTSLPPSFAAHSPPGSPPGADSILRI